MDGVILAATIVIAIAAVLSAGSAVTSVVLTRRLSEDNRALRKAGTEPEVVAYLGVEHHAAYIVYVVLENVGQGPACDVEYFVDADPKDFAEHGVLKLPAGTQGPVSSLLPQGGRSQRLMGSTYTLLGNHEKPGLQPFRVRLWYSNLRGVRIGPKSFLLDVSELGDLAEVVPAEERLARSLEKIEKHLGHFASGDQHLHVETITTAGRDAADEERHARWKERSALKAEEEEES